MALSKHIRYQLPDRRIVAVPFDDDEEVPSLIDYTLANGRVVLAIIVRGRYHVEAEVDHYNVIDTLGGKRRVVCTLKSRGNIAVVGVAHQICDVLNAESEHASLREAVEKKRGTVITLDFAGTKLDEFTMTRRTAGIVLVKLAEALATPVTQEDCVIMMPELSQEEMRALSVGME